MTEVQSVAGRREHYAGVALSAMTRGRGPGDVYARRLLSVSDLGKLDKDSRVLEIGCGRGRLLSHIANETGAHCVGVDLEDYSVGDRPYEFVMANAEQLPFADNSFDRVYSIWTLPYVVDKMQVVRETYRVLDKGGLGFLHFLMLGMRPTLDLIIERNKLGRELSIMRDPKNSNGHILQVRKTKPTIDLPQLQGAYKTTRFLINSHY